MPPSAKFTKEEIISAALEITRESGFEAITARAIGAKLQSSARPIFTVFNNMDEVLGETVVAIKGIYNEYVTKALAKDIPFKAVGTAYISFARKEPNFFRLLFMSPNQRASELANILPAIDDNSNDILNSIMKIYGLSREKSYELYKLLWIFTHGIASLCATNVCTFSDEEISELLTSEFIGVLIKIKSTQEDVG